jgi:thiol-disulfide isomerase/thioredoxin
MLDNIRSMIGGANFKLDWKFFLIMLAVALLIGAIAYVYQKYVAPKLNPQYVANKEFVNESSSDKDKVAHITLFSASWCPHCRNLKKSGVWDDFTRENNSKVVNGYKLNIQEVDASDDNNPQVKSLLDQYSVDGFPSIKLLKDGDNPKDAIDFDAKPEKDSLNQFVSTVL